MITFKRLHLQNIIYYKEAELDLSHVGLTVIKGRNYNVIKGMIRNNGSGKSLLVSALASLLGFGSPASNTSKRSVSRDLMGVGASLTLDLSVDENNYRFVKSQPNKALAYSVWENRKNLKLYPPSAAAEKIRDIIGITEDEFFSLVYLDSRRPYLLQTGNPGQRLSFFSSLFRLDDYDTIRSHITAALSELKDTRIRHDTLQGELDIASTDLSNVDATALRQSKESMEADLGKLNEELHTLQDRFALWRLYCLHLPIKKEIAELEATLGVNEKSIASVSKSTQLLLLTGTKYDHFLSEKEKVRISLAEVRREIREIRDHLDSDERTANRQALREWITIIHARQQEYTKLLDQYRSLKGRLVECEPVTDSLDIIREQLRIVENDRAIARSELAVLLEQEVHLKKHLTLNSSVCVACGASLTVDQAKAKLKGVVSQIGKQETVVAELVNDLDNLFRQAQQSKAWEKNEQIKQKMREVRVQAKEVQKDFVNVDVDTLELLLDKAATLDSLKAMVPEWNGETPTEDTKTHRDRYELLTKLQNYYNNWSHIKSKFSEAEALFKRVPQEEKLVAKIALIKTKMSEIHNALPTVKAKLMHHKTLVAKAKGLKTIIADLKAELKDTEILGLLQDAYSAKGLKTLVAQRIAAMIQRNMNNYSNLLFPEPFQFKFVVDVNRFDILVRRKAGNSYKISDVRFLSGAESRAFTLLCLISILPLIPKNRRTNICILDELEANLDESGKDLFINQFLPAFNLVVPHVVVVTPGENVYPDSRVFIATKRGNETRLLQDMAAP